MVHIHSVKRERENSNTDKHFVKNEKSTKKRKKIQKDCNLFKLSTELNETYKQPSIFIHKSKKK